MTMSFSFFVCLLVRLSPVKLFKSFSTRKHLAAGGAFRIVSYILVLGLSWSRFLAECYYVKFGYCHCNFVCRLSVCCQSVTLVYPSPTHRVYFFRNIFEPYCSLVIWLGIKKTARKYSPRMDVLSSLPSTSRNFRPISRFISQMI